MQQRGERRGSASGHTRSIDDSPGMADRAIKLAFSGENETKGAS